MVKASVERKAAAAKKAGDAKGGRRLIASNRKARHNYSILDVFEAGVVLVGTEVKSLRDGQASLADAFATVAALWLQHCCKSPGDPAGTEDTVGRLSLDQ